MVTNDQSRFVDGPRGWADPAPVGPSGDGWRRAVPLVTWLVCLAVALLLLGALGGGRLAAPALTDPAGWGAWASGRDPLEVAMVVLRLVALGLAWYLVGVTSLSVVAHALRAARMVRIADALSVGPVRVLVQQALGIGLAAGVVAAAVPGTAATADGVSEVAVMAPVEQEVEAPRAVAAVAPFGDAPAAAAPSGPVGTSAATGPSAPVPAPASAPGQAATGASSSLPGPAGSAATTPAPPPSGQDASTESDTAQATGQREVRVAAGDHFWAIAERDVAGHLGRPGSERQVLLHWRAVIDANAERLTVPGNPDVLVPGQRIVLPDVAEVLR